MGLPSVHIVLINWNSVADTLECLDSLMKQDYPSSRIIVVDNASRDDEASVIEHAHPSVTVLRQQANLGFCGGNNVGIKHALAAGADYVLVLNNDTIVPPSMISRLVRVSQEIPNVGAVSPLILCYPETDLVWYAGSFWEAETATFRHPLQYRSIEELRCGDSPFMSQYACGCGLLVSANVLREVGLMDERYFAYYDEADWCCRMKNAGLMSYVVPTATLYHKVSKATSTALVTYFTARNRLLWMKENLSWRERVRSHPYLFKEVLWNILNIFGFPFKRKYKSAIESRVMLMAIRDFWRRSFGAPSAKITQLAGLDRQNRSAEPVRRA